MRQYINDFKGKNFNIHDKCSSKTLERNDLSRFVTLDKKMKLNINTPESRL